MPVPLPPETLELLRRSYDVWNAGGPAAMAREVWGPDIVWHDPPDFPDASVVRGAPSVRDHLQARIDTLGHSPVQVEGALAGDDGEWVLIELGLRSGGQLSGVRLETRLYHVVRLREGRPVEVREFLNDRERALAALEP